MSPSTPTEAVGVWQDGDGSSNKQFWELIKKIRAVHLELDANPLPRHLVWMGFKQALWSSISYVLPAMSLTKQDALQLNKEIYRRLLPKLGCNRNFPLLLRYNAGDRVVMIGGLGRDGDEVSGLSDQIANLFNSS